MKKPTTKRKKAVTSAATTPAETTVVKPLEPAIRQAWRARVEQRIGLLPKRGTINPLLELPDGLRCEIFNFMRKATYTDQVLEMLEEHGVTDVLPLHLENFYETEAGSQYERRLLRAAHEANALIKVVDEHKVEFSPATLAALQQEIFRQISSGEAEPAAISKLGTLFLRVKHDLRADEMHDLRYKKLKHDLQGQIDHALEKLSEEVNRHPAARATFEALRQELANCLEEKEESL